MGYFSEEGEGARVFHGSRPYRMADGPQRHGGPVVRPAKEERLYEGRGTLNTIQLESSNAEGLGSYLRDFVSSFADLDNEERKLLVESLEKS